jgi:hypothetical protein
MIKNKIEEEARREIDLFLLQQEVVLLQTIHRLTRQDQIIITCSAVDFLLERS